MKDFQSLFTSFIDETIKEKFQHFLNDKTQNLKLVEIQKDYKRIRLSLEEIKVFISEINKHNIFNLNKNNQFSNLFSDSCFAEKLSNHLNKHSSHLSPQYLPHFSPSQKSQWIIKNLLPKTFNSSSLSVVSNLDIIQPLQNKTININDTVFVCDQASIIGATWKLGIIEAISKQNEKVLFTVKLNNKNLTVESNKLAFSTVPLTHLKIGTNIIARCKQCSSQSAQDFPLIAGIVAEPPKTSNSHRYLIFFNTVFHISNYVNLDEIYLIAKSNLTPWTDFHLSHQDFIKQYCINYPERLMVKVKKNEKIKVKLDQNWKVCQVLEVDSSIIKIASAFCKQKEWIYRGSLRLWPIYYEMFHQFKDSFIFDKKSEHKQISDSKWFNNTNGQSITICSQKKSNSDLNETLDNLVNRKQIARKSTSKPISNQNLINHNSKLKEKKFEFIISQNPKILITTKKYTSHICCNECIGTLNQELKTIKNENPYNIPIILGWQRQISITKLNYDSGAAEYHEVIFYIAPCGRRLRNLHEIDNFLLISNCQLTIDYFVFETNFELFHYHQSPNIIKCYYVDDDISKGKENMPISVVNTIDDEMIDPKFHYQAKRFGGRGVTLPLDENFLVSCGCEDNCRSRSTCDCQQLTISSTEIIPGQVKDKSAGYYHKRLKNFLITGIYECNSKCTCNSSCQNRVVQQGIKVKLQIFKTLRRGWGVRTLHDIPKGAFITVYAAEVLTDSIATQDGYLNGDEYLADLDYIDVCENIKANYEAAPQEEISSDEFESEDTDQSDDKDYRISSSKLNNSKLNSWSFRPRNDQSNQKIQEKKSFKPIREYYNELFSYTLNAKKSGNIGRYLNHSCSPNCFVQNVFVDTHDLRFPWVAIFAAQNIPAFSELTWDYNYEVGSVEGKKKFCYCMSAKCKGRLI